MRKAAREVRKLTKGAVTDGRAKRVYETRAPGTFVPSDQPTNKEAEENQAVGNEPDSVEMGEEQETTTKAKN